VQSLSGPTSCSIASAAVEPPLEVMEVHSEVSGHDTIEPGML